MCGLSEGFQAQVLESGLGGIDERGSGEARHECQWKFDAGD